MGIVLLTCASFAGFVNGGTQLQIQTSIAMTLSIATLVLVLTRNQTLPILNTGEIRRAIITILVALTSGMSYTTYHETHFISLIKDRGWVGSDLCNSMHTFL